MWGHLTWLTDEVAEVRLFDDHQRRGEPWQWGCVAVWHGTTVELRLASRAPPRDRGGVRALVTVLRDHGMHRMTWERHDKDGALKRVVDVNPSTDTAVGAAS